MRLFQRLKGTRITKSDMGYLSLRLTLSAVLLCFGYIGLGVLLLLNYLAEKFIQWKYGVMPLNSTDKNVFYD